MPGITGACSKGELSDHEVGGRHRVKLESGCHLCEVSKKAEKVVEAVGEA